MLGWWLWNLSQGPFDRGDCPCKHSINPYSNRESRILFSTWNLDHMYVQSVNPDLPASWPSASSERFSLSLFPLLCSQHCCELCCEKRCWDAAAVLRTKPWRQMKYWLPLPALLLHRFSLYGSKPLLTIRVNSPLWQNPLSPISNAGVKQTRFAKLISLGKKIICLVIKKEFHFCLALKGRWRLDYSEKTSWWQYCLLFCVPKNWEETCCCPGTGRSCQNTRWERSELGIFLSAAVYPG